MSAPPLRPYQVAAVEQIEAAYEGGARAPLLALATGGGKTRVAAELITRATTATDGTALFLAPRRELVSQASAALTAVGIDHGVFMAGADDLENPWASVTVASVDTALVRVLRRGRRPFPDPSMIIIDEAHLSITKHRQALLNLWPEARRLGLTATPSRKDGKALGVIYDRLVEPITVDQLVEHGYLVPARYFSLSEPDLARVGTVAGDYNQRQLAQAVNKAELVADIVETWLARAGGRRTAVFATDIAHSTALAEAFQRAGVAAEHVDAKTPTDQRAATFERFREGDTQVLCNCLIATIGFDLPAMSCVVLARPTKSLVLYLQMVGRGLRPAEGKSDCLVLDHSGAVHRHGFATDPRVWTLEGKTALDTRASATKAREEPKQIDCPSCAAVFSGSRTCPECGYELVPKGRMVETLDGELIEVGVGLEPSEMGGLERRLFYGELLGYAAEKGWKRGAAAYRYKDKFGTFPPWSWNNDQRLAPSLETRRWLKSRAIAWARAKRRAAG